MQAAAPTVAPMAEAGVAVPPAPTAPSPNYIPPTPPSAIAPSMEDGGETSKNGGIKAFFSDVNIVDVTVSAFIVAAVIYSIQYHKYMMMIEKTGYADLSSRIQKLESSLEASKRKSEANASGNGNNMRRKRTLMSL